MSRLLIITALLSSLACGSSSGADGGAGGGAVGGGGAAGGGSGGGTIDAGPANVGAACTYAAPLSQCTGASSCYLSSPNDFTTGVCRAGCDVVAQNCANDGDCSYSEGVRRCFENLGTIPEGAGCNDGGSDCVKGTLCVGEQGASAIEYTCRKFCRRSGDCTGDSQCNVAVPAAATEYATVCRPQVASCELLLQNCPSGQACYPTSSTATACFSAGTLAEGAACAAANLCAPGNACLGTMNNTSCRKLCNLDGGTPACATGECSKPGGLGFAICF